MLTKADLIEVLHSNTPLSQMESERAINLITDAVATDLAVGGDAGGAIIKGFGRIYVAERKARVGRNLYTGEVVQIPAKRTVKFKPAKALADRVNGG